MDYLTKYIQALEQVILDEQKIIIVDANSMFKYISPDLRNQNNLINLNLDGMSYGDVKSINQIATSCVSEDIECLESRKVQKYITSQNHNGKILLYIKQKSPIIDPNNDIVVGVRIDFNLLYSLGHFKPYIHNYITKVADSSHKNENNNKIYLTETEELILFLLILYSKPKVITSLLNHILNKNISVSTVRNIIHQQILRKFKLPNVEDLIDKAIFLGYDTMLPRIMVDQFSIRVE